jgi:hypothetical protein
MTTKTIIRFIKSLILLPLLIFSFYSHAGLITVTLGNDAPGFADGTVPSVPQIGLAQAGQPAPFDQGYGHSLFGPHFSGDWMFNYAAITETILSATITIGIADHDSQASGDQVTSYIVDGNDMTLGLNTAFESIGGSDQEYNIYTLAFNGSSFAGLADGTAAASLGLKGPGLITTIGGAIEEISFNPAFLIFSTLEIVYKDANTPPTSQIPEPSTLILFSLGLLIIGRRKLI